MQNPVRSLRLLAIVATLGGLGGCDLIQERLGIEDPAKKAAKLEADGRAVGGGCRHSGRAIEDCYAIYHWLPRAAIFAGWQEMDTYMRDNKIETIEPQLPPPQPPEDPRKKKSKKKPAAAEETAAKAEEHAAGNDAAPKEAKAEEHKK